MGYRFEEDKVQPVIVVEPRSDGFSVFEHDDYVINSFTTFASLSGRGRVEIPLVGSVSIFYPESDLMLVGPGSGIDEIVQPFMVDQDNVYSLAIPFKGFSVYTLWEDFERYANTDELRAVWVPASSARFYDDLVVVPGNKYMQLVAKANAQGYYVRRTFDSLRDWSQFTGIQMRVASNDTYLFFRIIDNAGSIASVPVPNVGSPFDFVTVYLPFSSFSPMGANFPDLSRISAVDFLYIGTVQTAYRVDDLYVVRLPNMNVQYQIGEVRLEPFEFMPLMFDDGSDFKVLNVSITEVGSFMLDIQRGIWNRSNVLDRSKKYGVRLYNFNEAGYIGVNRMSPNRMWVLSGGSWVEQDKNVAFICVSELRDRIKRLQQYSIVLNNFAVDSGLISGFLVKDGKVTHSLFVNQIPGNIDKVDCELLMKDERVVVELNPFRSIGDSITLQVSLKFRVERVK